MGAVEFVVPVAGHEEGGRRLDPTGDQSQHVERCLVCPVDVLEDDDARAGRAQQAEKEGAHFVRLRASRKGLFERAPGPLGDVEERPGRPGGGPRPGGAARPPPPPPRRPEAPGGRPHETPPVVARARRGTALARADRSRWLCSLTPSCTRGRTSFKPPGGPGGGTRGRETGPEGWG